MKSQERIVGFFLLLCVIGVCAIGVVRALWELPEMPQDVVVLERG
jgi:hypothetical protein